MSKIFLDTNIFIDAIHRAPERQILEVIEGHIIYLSALSFHIYCYAFKIKIPNKKVLEQKSKFQTVDLSAKIIDLALQGPTEDLEDNIQLHSAVEADCDFFFTSDQILLKMGIFGKTKITSSFLNIQP